MSKDGGLPPGVTDADIDRATWSEWEATGQCDTCGKMGHIRQTWYLGYMETWVCDECGDGEP